MQYDNLGMFVRNKRKMLAKSLNNFAFDCGVEPATLSKFEQGKSDILLGNFLKIINGFQQSPTEFFSEFEKS